MTHRPNVPHSKMDKVQLLLVRAASPTGKAMVQLLLGLQLPPRTANTAPGFVLTVVYIWCG